MTRRSPALIAALLLATSAGRAEDKTENDIRRSVVRITATQRLIRRIWENVMPG